MRSLPEPAPRAESGKSESSNHQSWRNARWATQGDLSSSRGIAVHVRAASSEGSAHQGNAKMQPGTNTLPPPTIHGGSPASAFPFGTEDDEGMLSPGQLAISDSHTMAGASEATQVMRVPSEWTVGEFCSCRGRRQDLSTWQNVAMCILNHPAFDCFIGVVILLNAATIGVGLEFSNRDTSDRRRLGASKAAPLGIYAASTDPLTAEQITLMKVVSVLEPIFLVIYLLELLLRFYAFRLSALKDNWIRFDLVMVVTGIVTDWIVVPLAGNTSSVNFILVLRTARLLRLARAVRLMSRFKELWMLVRGLFHSATTMLHTVALLGIVLYMFGCAGHELLANHSLAQVDGPFKDCVDTYFRTLGLTLLTLVQFVTDDNLVYVYRPLILADWTLLFYFMPLMMIVTIVLMNLITAVIVNSAMEASAEDKETVKLQAEEKRKKQVKQLRRVFLRLDQDKSGQVSRDEVTGMDQDDLELIKTLCQIENPLELFDALDVDGSGEIDIDEFCDGIWRISISKTPMEVKKIEKHAQQLSDRMKFNEEKQREILAELRGLRSAQDQLLELLGGIQATSPDDQANGGGAARGVAGVARLQGTPPAQSSPEVFIEASG